VGSHVRVPDRRRPSPAVCTGWPGSAD
jgi:hypothetical protein